MYLDNSKASNVLLPIILSASSICFSYANAPVIFNVCTLRLLHNVYYRCFLDNKINKIESLCFYFNLICRMERLHWRRAWYIKKENWSYEHRFQCIVLISAKNIKRSMLRSIKYINRNSEKIKRSD